MRKITLVAIVLAAAVAVASPATAHANAVSKIYYKCGHGESIGGFTVHAYREALRHMETEMAEYSECAELIGNAELAAVNHRSGQHGRQSGSSKSSGSDSRLSTASAIGNQPMPVSPTEHDALRNAQRHGSNPVQIGLTKPGSTAESDPIEPGVVHVDLASAASAIPGPLLAIIALLSALVLATGGRAVILNAFRRRKES